jgi:ABC-2 type transport system permease protein
VKVVAILIDTGRELLFRRTILVYFGLVTLALLFFTLILQAGLTIEVRSFSGQGGAPGPPGADALVRWVQFGTAFALYPVAILLSAFATASLIPRMLEKGTIDLLLSKPISRPMLFASRYLGGLLIAGANLVYLASGFWLIMGLKTGVWNGGFLLSGLVMTIYFACLLGFMSLVGVLSRSTTVTVMLTSALFFVGMIVSVPHQSREWPRLIDSGVLRFVAQALVEVLYHALPRTYEFGGMAAALILREGSFDWGPILGSAASGAGALALAVVYFSRKDY